jgi:hypothetical protein
VSPRHAAEAALVGIAAVAALVILAWKFGGGNPSPATYPGLGKSASTSVRTAPAQRRPHGIQLVLAAANGASWVQVRSGSVTGKELYRGTLDLGQTQRFNAQRLWLRVAVPANVQVRVNGHAAQLAGSKAGIFVATRSGLRRTR